MPANDRQHGGDHYKKFPYEHWDFVCDTGQHYLVGCATKYAARWRSKGGIQDLEKMVHYLDKAEERGVTRPTAYHNSHLERFCEQLGPIEALLVRFIMTDAWDGARNLVFDIKREKRDANAS